MGFARTLAGIIVLSAIGFGVYTSMTRNPPQSSGRLDTAPQWSSGGLTQNQSPPPPLPNGLTPPPNSPGVATAPTTPTVSLGTPMTPPPPSPVASTPAHNQTPATLPPLATQNPPPAPPAVNPPAPQPPAPSAADIAALAAAAAGSPPPKQASLPNIPAPVPAPPPPPPPAVTSLPPVNNSKPSTPSFVPSPVANPYVVSPPPAVTTPANPSAGAPPASAAPAGNAIASSPPKFTPLPPVVPQSAVSPSNTPLPTTVREEFAKFMHEVRVNLAAGHIDSAHRAMSELYGNPRLTAAERQQLTQLLDQTAGTVIYSRQNLVEAPYHAQTGDTLERIGQIYSVSPELLSKINGLPLGQPLTPGTDVKVLHGPFEAQVDLSKREMTLFVQGRYAGRFPVSFGLDQLPMEGKFTVRAKTVSPSAVLNRPGKPQLDLDHQVTIHAMAMNQSVGRGGIELGDRDLGDVCDILSVGSTVTIRR